MSGVDSVWIRAKPWIPYLLLVSIAASVYVVDLDRQERIYFDEIYYVLVAHQMADGLWEDPCWEGKRLDPRPLNWEHPPLGKLILAATVDAWDPNPASLQSCRSTDESGVEAVKADLLANGNPYAWRLPSALFGTVTVAAAGLATARLFRSPGAGAVASALLLADGVMMTSSRIAMLDIYVTGFTVAALAAATFVGRRATWTMAMLLALGFACKFSAAFAGPGIALVHGWAHYRAGLLDRSMFDRTLVALSVTPPVVLILTYMPWWLRWIPTMGFGGAIGHWIDLHQETLRWGTSFVSKHPYVSPPSRWLTMERPTWLYVKRDVAPEHDAFLYSMGNPILWWGGSAMIVATLAWAALRRGLKQPFSRDAQAAFFAALVPALTYAVFLQLGRATFLYYTTLLVPLLCVATAGICVIGWRAKGPLGRVGVPAFLLLVLGAMLHYWPIVYGTPVTDAEFEAIFGLLPWATS